MKQIEIQFFWPLTEQIPLDLDYAPSVAFEEEHRKKMYSNSVLISNGVGSASWGTVTTTQSLANMTEFRPNPNSAGHWKVSPELNYYVSKEPNRFIKKMTKLILGWEWGNKN